MKTPDQAASLVKRKKRKKNNPTKQTLLENRRRGNNPNLFYEAIIAPISNILQEKKCVYQDCL